MKTTDFIREDADIGAKAHAMHLDHEVQMAREQCYHSAENAIALHKLLKNISEEQGLEGWVSEKLSLAADYLKTVKEHLEYELLSQEEQSIPVFDLDSAHQQFESAVSEGAQNIAVHDFSKFDSREIYDMTQTEDNIHDGDVMICPGGVAIMVEAWPVTVVGDIHGFHKLGPDQTWETFEGGQYLASAHKAMSIGKQNVAESKGLGQYVEITKGPHAGSTGWIRQIQRNGPLTSSPKAYFIDLDDGTQVNNVPSTAFRVVNKQARDAFSSMFGGNANDLTSKLKIRERKVRESAGGMGAASVGTAMAGNGFVNGGPGTISRPKLKKAKK